MLGCSDSQDATTSSGTPSCPGCNLVLLTFDALRADRLGVYGYDKDTSPNLDALAARSSVFARCVAQAPYTLASVPSFLTSKFSSADRLLDDGVLRAEERTLTGPSSRSTPASSSWKTMGKDHSRSSIA